MIDLHLTIRRKGEILMTVSGIALAIGAASISVPQVAYAGLCISGLGIVSMLWRWLLRPILYYELTRVLEEFNTYYLVWHE